MFVAASASAKCPTSLPEQLFQDCIVTEGAGDPFPESDYAYLEEYKEWLMRQQLRLSSDAAGEAQISDRD